jgi:mRNA interferase RelE/StbE
MLWQIVYSAKILKFLRKLDKNSQLDLKNYLEKISNCEKPMIFGKALEGSLQGFWRYRVGKFRIVCKIDNHKMIIVIIDIDHRSKIYKYLV